MICHRLDPAAVAASMVVGETPRMPSATILMAAGAAKVTAAMIAVNRVGPNSASAGMRYTKGGMICAASRIGRMTASAVTTPAHPDAEDDRQDHHEHRCDEGHRQREHRVVPEVEHVDAGEADHRDQQCLPATEQYGEGEDGKACDEPR